MAKYNLTVDSLTTIADHLGATVHIDITSPADREEVKFIAAERVLSGLLMLRYLGLDPDEVMGDVFNHPETYGIEIRPGNVVLVDGILKSDPTSVEVELDVESKQLALNLVGGA